MATDSKTKLNDVLFHMERFILTADRNMCTLQRIVKNYDGYLREARNGTQQSLQMEGEESKDRNETDVKGSDIDGGDNEDDCKTGEREDENVPDQIRFGEDRLRVLMDIEEHLGMLQQSEDGQQLWKETINTMRKWWMEIEGPEYDDIIDRILWMVWKRKDSVWLLGCKPTKYVENGQFLRKVRDTLQQINPTDNRARRHPNTPEGRQQVFAIFQERHPQWEQCRDSLRHLCDTLTEMYFTWPDHRGVHVRTRHIGNHNFVCRWLRTIE